MNKSCRALGRSPRRCPWAGVFPPTNQQRSLPPPPARICVSPLPSPCLPPPPLACPPPLQLLKRERQAGKPISKSPVLAGAVRLLAASAPALVLAMAPGAAGLQLGALPSPDVSLAGD